MFKIQVVHRTDNALPVTDEYKVSEVEIKDICIIGYSKSRTRRIVIPIAVSPILIEEIE